MPRPRNPANEEPRAAQERDRTRIRQIGRPETDAVDTAVAAAVAVYGLAAQTKKSGSDWIRFEALERMSANYLASKGKTPSQALRKVRRRLRRLDAQDLVALVNDPA